MCRGLAGLPRGPGVSFASPGGSGWRVKAPRMYLLVSFCNVKAPGRSALCVLNAQTGEFWPLERFSAVGGGPPGVMAGGLPHRVGARGAGAADRSLRATHHFLLVSANPR